MEYEWNIRHSEEPENTAARQLAAELKISTLAAHILIRRGLQTADEARRYIRPTLHNLHDPFLMRDMSEAVSRLDHAITTGEKILVYGDYDADGTTAVALFYSYLQRWTSNIGYYIPDRYAEGYGISFAGIDYAEAEGYTLIVALDCGIKAVDKVEYAQRKGIDFIICDHHTPGDEIPKAVAVLNMKRKDCPYPYKDLSGCGVGFKLVQGHAITHGVDEQELLPLLPYLAISIASDVVSVTDENRLLAHYGLRQLNMAPPIGIQAILEKTNSVGVPMTITDVVFKLGSRINACGRMNSGAEAVRLLLTNDIDFARKQAEAIEQYNADRRDKDSTATKEALQMLAEDPDNDSRCTTVVYSPKWHRGVVGITASRLTETYYRPTIVLTDGDDGIVSGSARSVEGFDIYNAIDSCRDLLTNFGGHCFAAGLSLRLCDLPEFKRRFEQYVSEHITPEQQHPTLHVDAEIQLEDITDQFVKILRCLEPFGPGNEKPLFVTRNLINNRYTKRVGQQGEHLKLDVTDRQAAITGIAFGFGDLAPRLKNGLPIDVCYHIEDNIYNGKRSVQMRVVDIHCNN